MMIAATTTIPATGFTQADFEAYDSRPNKKGAEYRFCCPFCGNNKPRDDAHRSLALNSSTGLYQCFRCHERGLVKEKWTPTTSTTRRQRATAALARAFSVSPLPSPAPVDKNAVTGDFGRDAAKTARLERMRRQMSQWQVAFENSPGQTYLEQRGIGGATAKAFGCGYADAWEHWKKNDAGEWKLEGTDRRVVYPIIDRAGNLIAVHGRAIDDGFLNSPKISKGDKSDGLFQTADALRNDVVVVVEGPADAMALHVAGVSAVAVVGTSAPKWFASELAFGKVFVALDADDSGDNAAESLITVLRSRGARAFRLRPNDAKDWNEVLEKFGSESLRSVVENQIADIFEFRKLRRRFEPVRTVPTNCPLCTSELKIESGEVLTVRFCPLGCEFVETVFACDYDAAYDAVAAMFEQMTFDELQAVSDALDERAGMIADDFDVDDDAAMRSAENDVLPAMLAGYLSKKKFRENFR